MSINDHQDHPQNQLDPTIIEAITTGTVRDRQILIQAETEMTRFISSSLQRLPLSSSLSNSLNSYQRMLLHRLGDSFGIKRSIESGQLIIERTQSSACPSVRLETLIVRLDPSPSDTDPNTLNPTDSSSSALSISTSSSDQPHPPSSTSSSSINHPSHSIGAPPKTFKIMSRALSQSNRQPNRSSMPSTASSGSSVDPNPLSESKRNELSYEERQAAYLEARNRIFANSRENSTSESIAGSTSSSAAAAAAAPAAAVPPPPPPPPPIPAATGPDQDHPNLTTTHPSKSKSHPDSPSAADGSIETRNSTNQIRTKARNDRPIKPSAKLRPSATSFDPSAKAHGYEEVTIIELEDQSITVLHQDPHMIFNYLNHPNHLPIPQQNGFPPNGYPRAPPRSTHLSPNGYKIFPAHSWPSTGPVASHPSLPPNNHHPSTCGAHPNLGPHPSNSILLPPPPASHSIAPPPPFVQAPPYPSATDSTNPPMPTMIGTVPLNPIPPSQSNLPAPDPKFYPIHNPSHHFRDDRAQDSIYHHHHHHHHHSQHPLGPNPIPPSSSSDPSSHSHPTPTPNPPFPFPPASHPIPQHQPNLPFIVGSSSNAFTPDFQNHHPHPHLPPPPPPPPSNSQLHQSSSHPSSIGYSNLGPPSLEINPPMNNGSPHRSSTPNYSIPPPPTINQVHHHHHHHHHQERMPDRSSEPSSTMIDFNRAHARQINMQNGGTYGLPNSYLEPFESQSSSSDTERKDSSVLPSNPNLSSALTTHAPSPSTTLDLPTSTYANPYDHYSQNHRVDHLTRTIGSINLNHHHRHHHGSSGSGSSSTSSSGSNRKQSSRLNHPSKPGHQNVHPTRLVAAAPSTPHRKNPTGAYHSNHSERRLGSSPQLSSLSFHSDPMGSSGSSSSGSPTDRSIKVSAGVGPLNHPLPPKPIWNAISKPPSTTTPQPHDSHYQ